MKKTYSTSKIDEALNVCIYADTLRSLQIPFFLIEYESGERVSNYNYFQVVISGNLSISFIRDDGSAYSLSNGGKNYVIGEMDLFVAGNDNVLAEAISPLLTIAIDTVQYLNYMQFKCDNHILSGIEKTAFRLHCSPRQLQRILNQFEKDNVVTKIGKGRYIMKD